MANDITGVTAVDATRMELISSIVQDELIQAGVLINTVWDSSAFAQPGSKSYKIPKAGSFVAQNKGEATELNAQALTMDGDTVLLDKHQAVLADVEDIAEMQANVAILQEYIKRMASALALKMDQELYTQMKLASASNPDHLVAYASGSALTKADFTNSRKLLRIANVPMDGNLFLAISPAQEAAILGLSDFVDADKWAAGSEMAKLNGVIGRAYGFNVVVSNVIDDLGSMFYHRMHATFGRQMAPKYETQRHLANLSNLAAISHLYGVKVLNGGKMAVKVGSAS